VRSGTGDRGSGEGPAKALFFVEYGLGHKTHLRFLQQHLARDRRFDETIIPLYWLDRVGDLLGKLLTHVGSLQRSAVDPRGMSLSTLTTREADMLRMVSEGLDTAEIARKTAYSERTVKNVLHEVITRLQLRNRAHAVGYALRNGLI